MKIAVAGAFTLLAAVGCAPPGLTPPMPVERIDGMTLVALTLPLRSPEQKGPVGVQVQVFFYTNPAGEPESATVSGTLQMIMFDGPIKNEDIPVTKPLLTWTFTRQQLSMRLIKSMGLWCYLLPLEWGDKPPKSNSVTIIARYNPPNGPPMYSSQASVILHPG